MRASSSLMPLKLRDSRADGKRAKAVFRIIALDPVQVAHQALRAASQHTRPTDGDSVVRGFQREDNFPRNQARDKSRGKDEAERVGGAAATKILAVTQ